MSMKAFFLVVKKGDLTLRMGMGQCTLILIIV